MSDVLCFDFCSLIAVSVWVSVFGLHDHDACVCDTKVGYTVSVHVCWEDIQCMERVGACTVSVCMCWVLVYGQNFVSAFQTPFFNAIQRL